jgi:hypothetical protein
VTLYMFAVVNDETRMLDPSKTILSGYKNHEYVAIIDHNVVIFVMLLSL